MMKRLTSVCVVIAVLATGTAAGQEGEKRSIKQLTMFLIDARNEGVSEQTETTGTGIKRIEIPDRAVDKKVILDSKDMPRGKEWVVKFVKTTLADDTVVNSQILLPRETGKVTLQNVRNGGPSVVSDNGTRTWYTFCAEYDVAADSSKENIAQAKNDMEGLQGTWRRHNVTKVVVEGDKMTIYDSRPGQEEMITGVINIDPKTKALDWTGRLGIGIGVFTKMGIYEVKGDDLKIYFGGELERATSFDGKVDGTDGWLLVLKREKP
jgi:hypothetical protein